MSMGEQWQKIKNFIGINNDDRYDYDDEYEYEDDEDYAEDVPPVAPVVIETKVFEDSESITHQLRDMRPVLINFENTDPHEAARIVDFVSGATFALDGKLEKVGKDIFMCVPVNVSIDYNNESESGTTEQQEFNWQNK